MVSEMRAIVFARALEMLGFLLLKMLLFLAFQICQQRFEGMLFHNLLAWVLPFFGMRIAVPPIFLEEGDLVGEITDN